VTLFVVRHWHASHRCPAADPEQGGLLLSYLSGPQAARYGVQIRAEAVVQGEHTLYLVAEAHDESSIREFMTPFAGAGSVEISPASTCAHVVASGGCAGVAPEADDGVVMMSPEVASQHAIDSGLVVHRAHPLNCETSIPALIGGVVMPSRHFYVRNHFQIPLLDPETWELRVEGLVERPLRLSLRELQRLPSRTDVVTLECAGNGRSQLDPQVAGEQWGLGAVSTAEWTGVPLAEILDRAGVAPGAIEVAFRGADHGTVEARAEPIHFERSLRVEQARDGDVVLAYAMNGEPLPARHGAPVRLVVPGWYGVASVKWLTQVEVLGTTFRGYFQHERYVYEQEGGVPEPVALQRVRALITEPRQGDTLHRGDTTVRGVAWSGAAPIARVDVAVDGVWHSTRLVGGHSRYSWQRWELPIRLERSGPTTIRARATDFADRAQPDEPAWNRLGYGNNAIQSVTFAVE
jgi:DMSO/TMAO reductase YedYZ molybdopterin-dependent catalytic subunit